MGQTQRVTLKKSNLMVDQYASTMQFNTEQAHHGVVNNLLNRFVKMKKHCFCTSKAITGILSFTTFVPACSPFPALKYPGIQKREQVQIDDLIDLNFFSLLDFPDILKEYSNRNLDIPKERRTAQAFLWSQRLIGCNGS